MIINVRTPQTDYFERTDTLVRYYEDIRKFDLLTQEQETALFNIIKFGNKADQKKAKDTIINSNQRFVVAVAKRFGTNNNVLDLINEGNIGLIEAIDSFDVDKNVKFTTWAVWYIRRAINLYSINNGSIVKKNNLSKTYHVISSATNKFMQKEHRAPSSDELLNILNKEYGLDIKDIGDIIETKVSSIDESFNAEEEDMCLHDTVLYNTYSASDNSYEKSIEDEFNKKLINTMLSKFTPREQTILKMTFGIGYEREYELIEIGEHLGLTTERVRQMKISLLNTLQKEYGKV